MKRIRFKTEEKENKTNSRWNKSNERTAYHSSGFHRKRMLKGKQIASFDKILNKMKKIHANMRNIEAN